MLEEFIKNYHVSFQFIKLLEGLTIKIVTNNNYGRAQSYFSNVLYSNTNDNADYIIYNIEDSLVNIPIELRDFYKNKSLRNKRMQSGYYNLNHFGSPIFFAREKNTYVLIGNIKDTTQTIWSFVIKEILTQYSIKNAMLHLKGSLIEKNHKGLLIVGDKNSGKSTLTYKLMKSNLGFKFVANTHILVDDDLNCYGIKSNINLRKDMIKSLNIIEENQLNIEEGKCVNIDPVELHYELSQNVKLEHVIYYSCNKEDKIINKQLSLEEGLIMMNAFSESIRVYNLESDIFEYFHKDTAKFCETIKNIDAKIKNIIASKGMIYFSFDMLGENVDTALRKINRL